MNILIGINSREMFKESLLILRDIVIQCVRYRSGKQNSTGTTTAHKKDDYISNDHRKDDYISNDHKKDDYISDVADSNPVSVPSTQSGSPCVTQLPQISQSSSMGPNSPTSRSSASPQRSLISPQLPPPNHKIIKNSTSHQIPQCEDVPCQQVLIHVSERKESPQQQILTHQDTKYHQHDISEDTISQNQLASITRGASLHHISPKDRVSPNISSSDNTVSPQHGTKSPLVTTYHTVRKMDREKRSLQKNINMLKLELHQSTLE